ncbi:phage shock protein PspA [Catenovulum adriaticum]|uniref:Phage shock protein PspA n=1 Tax=Catenovulum adriaticum TaxID=2984846 RepID=A0ABY7AKE3_9ALTE|nr:phage shock protein PspA [Catenovulum sp. TS8]WAJ69636.1 phage shock protein PspA [Catenovulum sp. TS8]
MGIFSRFNDIINSNLNALLDKAEDPAKMVRLIIQEMEDTLVEVRSNSAKTLAQKKDLNRQLDRVAQQEQEWQQKAELALNKGREDLARGALIEKNRLADVAKSISNELNQLDVQVEKLQSEIHQLQNKLTDAKARQQALLLKQNTVSSRLSVKRQLDSSKVEDTLNRFDAYERKIDDLEAQVDSYDLQQQNLKNEFDELIVQDEIDAEIEKMKAKMNTSSTGNHSNEV